MKQEHKLESPQTSSKTFNSSVYDHIAEVVRVLEFNQNNELVYVFCNKASLRIFELSPSEIYGKTVKQLYPGPLGLIADKHQRDAVRDKESKTYDYKLASKDGVQYRRATLMPALNDQGEVFRLVSTTQNVTAEKEAIEQRINSEALISEMETFTALAAHDLRTPMIHIASITEMIKTNVSALDEKQLMAVDMLEGLAETSMALIMRVLDRYRHVHAEHTEKQEFDLASPCMELYSVLDPFGRHRITVDQQWVVADKVAFQVVVGNLIDNALKHNGDASIELFVTARQTAANDMFEVIIRDTGKGFDSRVKKFFEDGKLQTSDHFGLSGIRQLIQSRNGTITIGNSADGGGAVISFTLPGRISRPSPASIPA